MPATLRVLVVDDSIDLADSLASALEFLGYDVAVANSGAVALERMEALRPQLVLMDDGMPGMTGCAVASHARTQPWRSAMTIIAMSGRGSDADRERMLAAGFDQHLVKPVELATLRDLLSALATAPLEERS